MGLNARNIHLHLWRVLHHSAEISYTFTQRHPLVSGALLVFFILYIFLSYIYNFLVYISPFLVCTAIFVRIFWSSEPIQLIYVKKVDKEREKERVEPKPPEHGRREVLYKCPSQNATSRRRNFTGKKLDVYGGLEQKAKDLSAVFQNEFTKSTKIRKFRSFQKEKGSLDYELSTENSEASTKQTLFSEPSMLDLVTCGAGFGGPEKETEKIKDEKEAQEDRNKSVELIEDDKKNLMDLGITEMERTKRLESLIARRRAKKLIKLHIEKALIDMKSIRTSQIAPLHIPRVQNSFEGIDGIEMPGSAPTTLRSPFDLPYDSTEEKPILTGDSFGQEFTSQQKDMPFCRHESFALGPSFLSEAGQDRLTYPRVRRNPDKGTHNWNEQLISKEGGESESKALNPPTEGEETTHEANEKCKIDMEVADMKDEEEESAHATKSMTDDPSEPGLIPNVIDVERASVSGNPVPKVPKPQERVFSFPISSSTSSVNDSLYEHIPSPVDKSNENMFFTTPWRICHTPSCSLGSDLQVEVSEVGSPTLTVDGSHETITTTDGESIIYDGDIDKDITSGSEDMWGASLHSREVRRLSEQDIAEASNLRDIASVIPLPNIDEENAADVSSMSSRSDMPDDTPTHAISSGHNFFGNVGETYAPQPFHPSYVPSHFKRLMDTRVDHLPDQTNLEKPEEWCDMSTNLVNKTQVIDDGNNSTTTEHDNTHNSKNNEDPGASVVQPEATNEGSISSSSSSSSPRSVLPQQTMEDHGSSSDYNQEMHLGVQQSNMEDMSQARLTVEGPLDSMPHNIYPSMDDPTIESHTGDLSHSQEQTYTSENSIQESNISSNMNGAEVFCKESEEKIKNDEISEKPIPIIRQDAREEPPGPAEMMTSEDMNETSRELLNDKVPLNSPILESSSEVHRHNEDESQASMRQQATMEPFINAEAMDTSYTEEFEGKHYDLNNNEARLSCRSAEESDKIGETDKANHGSEEVNFLYSESNHVVEDHMGSDISEDSPQPRATEVTKTEDSLRESDRMNKNEVTEQELNKNETMVLSDSAVEGGEASHNIYEKA